jgi:CheY-like chemotaxis protein
VAKLLLVDDDEYIRRSVAQTLKTDDHEVVGEAQNGQEALRLLAAGCEPDVIILDLHMPVMNGWDVLRTLRDSGKPVPPVIVLSTLDVEDNSLPVFAEIRKHAIDVEHLCATVRAAEASKQRKTRRRRRVP